MHEQISFGRFIAERRKHLHLTQAELAVKLGVSKSAIAKWETDGGLPDRDNLKRLSEAIHMSVDDLHKVIKNVESSDMQRDVNITSEVITMLESYGYQVIKPQNNKEGI